jgi:hypothetical protein
MKLTPKEQAQELIEELTFNCKECDNAKISALFVVDKILISIQDLPENNVRWDYWQQVKQEIEKL